MLYGVETQFRHVGQLVTASAILNATSLMRPRSVRATFATASLTVSASLRESGQIPFWNPVDKTANIILSNGNFTATNNNDADGGVRGNVGYSTGLFYFEVQCSPSWYGGDQGIGIATDGAVLATAGATTLLIALCRADGRIFINGAFLANIGSTAGATVRVAVNLNNSRIWFRSSASGAWNGIESADPSTNVAGFDISAFATTNVTSLFPFAAININGQFCTANFGDLAFIFPVPSGFNAWQLSPPQGRGFATVTLAASASLLSAPHEIVQAVGVLMVASSSLTAAARGYIGVTAALAASSSLDAATLSSLGAVAVLAAGLALSTNPTIHSPGPISVDAVLAADSSLVTRMTGALSSTAILAAVVALTADLFDPATVAWIATVVAAGGTVSTERRYLIDDLIRGLKHDGIWTKLDRLWIFAAENAQSALADLVNNSTAGLTSTNPTFTTDRGYTGNNSGHINTGYNPFSGGVLNTRNDSHWSFWSVNNTSMTATSMACGGNGSSDGMYWFFTGGSHYLRCHDQGSPSTITNLAGHFIASRSASLVRTTYQNGSSLATDTTNASQALENVGSYWVLASDPDNFATNLQTAMYSVGSNLNGGSDAANFYTRLRTYMTAVGVP